MSKKITFDHYLVFIDWQGEVKEMRMNYREGFPNFVEACKMIVDRELKSVQSVQLCDIRHVTLFEMTINPALYRPNDNDGVRHAAVKPPPPRWYSWQ